jgi:hypothetical protein
VLKNNPQRLNPASLFGEPFALKQVGYWRDEEDPRAPDPRKQTDLWNEVERARVIKHLRRGKRHAGWMGYSWCRFECGIADSKMGSSDLTDGVWIWPEGFVHYVEKHNVKPDQKFVDYVMRL